MKIIRIFAARCLILAISLGVSIGGGFASSAFAQTFRETIVIVNPDVKITSLGTTDSDYNSAFSINDSGQVAGWGGAPAFSSHAFITGPNGVGMTNLGAASEVYGINNSGQVVGRIGFTGGGRHGFITGPNGIGMTDLGPLVSAYGINDSGQVVGNYRNLHGFITGPNGVGITDLGEKDPIDINNSGQVVGSYEVHADDIFGNPFVYSRAFITGPDGVGMTDLGALGGLVSVASAINDSGQVAGWSMYN